ncbi:MAG: dienelactone hydrolase family protein [Tatlockia sp.]|jgi:dienelactone hydrolase
MICTEEIIYNDQGTLCHGFLAYDSTGASPRPTVMVAPDWGGRGVAACNKAVQLASMGYVGFAIDMYGEAKLGKDKVERRALMTPFRENRDALKARVLAAFDTVAQLPQVNSNQIAALGYCFGGLCVLDLARAGVNLKGAISFHGVLGAPLVQEQYSIQAKILILHGYDDPLVLPEEVNQFALEMTQKKVDWQIHLYGQTAHSFTDPTANDAEMGLHYNALADKRSWQSTVLFLQEIFGHMR